MAAKIRCAIYTRKSSEEGLQQEFNSLAAQREACAAYVASQKAEGWVLLPTDYDDGGLSGGTLERPALQRLLADIEAGLVDQIVVYKIDRLTRSLSDFARIVDRLEASGTSFVSVTQSFNTATSMGRLTLNMLLSFAQFEREVTAERIRDKIAASKRKGFWMGGHVPLGYQKAGRTLAVEESEAPVIRTLYDLYEELGSVAAVKAEADRRGFRSRRRVSTDGTVRGGTPLGRSHIHNILSNPLYAGRIRHKGVVSDGQHPALIDPARWKKLQARLQGQAARKRALPASGAASPAEPRPRRRTQSSPLAGKLVDESGDRLTPSHAKTRRGTRLRYYVSRRLIKGPRREAASGWRLPARELEELLGRLLSDWLAEPSLLVSLLPDLRTEGHALLAERLSALPREAEAGQDLTPLFALLQRVDLAPAEISVSLDQTALARLLGLSDERLAEAALTRTAPFQLRKRGVETKLVLAGQSLQRDEVLIANLAKAQRWFERVKQGESCREIAEQEGTSARRVGNVLELALLSPDLIDDILAGRQDPTLTSDRLIRQGVPAQWSEQRERLGAR